MTNMICPILQIIYNAWTSPVNRQNKKKMGKNEAINVQIRKRR